MITITAPVTIQCQTATEFDQAKVFIGSQNLVDKPLVDELKRTITFTVIQIVEAL